MSSSDSPALLASGQDEAVLFRTCHDSASFSFHHSLHRKFASYFSLESLREAAERVGKRHGPAYVESGNPVPSAKWGSAPGAVKPASLSEAIDSIRENSFWVVLTRLNLDPMYTPVMHEVLDELSLLVGYRVLARYYDPILTALVTSPNRVTPCHVDYDTNLLLQIQGPKEISVFDGKDTAIFPEAARERFWNGDTQAFGWNPDLQSRAFRVPLVPGLAVHVPAGSPHWLQNGPEVSVSVSINFKRRVDIVADTYKLNARLRRAGFSPPTPGRSQVHDRAMSLAWRSASAIAHLLHPRQPAA
ncbi:MAG TPA: hypothetical protein VGM02_07175 [Acidobacteriaceae bacterium]